VPGPQMAEQASFNERRIDMFVDDRCGWRQPCQRWHQFKQPRSNFLARHLAPAVVALPGTAHVLWPGRRNETGEYASLSVTPGQRRDPRQHPRHPWRVPGGRLGKNALQVDAEVERARAEQAKTQAGGGFRGGIVGRHRVHVGKVGERRAVPCDANRQLRSCLAMSLAPACALPSACRRQRFHLGVLDLGEKLLLFFFDMVFDLLAEHSDLGVE
jgi:hypothetical protein